MVFSLLFGVFILVLFFAFVFYELYKTHLQKAETMKRNLINHHLRIVNDSESLLSKVNVMPFSNALLVCLNQRILDSLLVIRDLQPMNQNVAQRIKNAQQQLTTFKEQPHQPNSVRLRVPAEEKGVQGLRQLVKDLLQVIKLEHKKGKLSTKGFCDEDERLKQLHLQISIENLLNHVDMAKRSKNLPLARELLEKAQKVLYSHSGEYVSKSLDRVEYLLSEISKEIAGQSTPASPDARREDINDLFAPKKKW